MCHLTSTFDLSDPKITVSVSADITPMAGSMLTLTCSVSGAEIISDLTTTYQWSRNGMMVPDQAQESWMFNSLSYSDAGQYLCAVDVSSSLLSSSINVASDAFNVTLTCKSHHELQYSRNIVEVNSFPT